MKTCMRGPLPQSVRGASTPVEVEPAGALLAPGLEFDKGVKSERPIEIHVVLGDENRAPRRKAPRGHSGRPA